MIRVRAALLASAFVPLLMSGPASARPRAAAPVAAAPAASSDVIQSIRVEGNQRIETGTILSYMLAQPGDPFSGDRVDRSLRTLYATGLFADVALQRDGNALVVRVAENPIVFRIAFEGNHAAKEEDLRKELELRPRAVFTPSMAQADRQKLLVVYAGKGRFAATVEPQIIRLPQNRVNVVFKIVEGPETQIARIVFVGNHAYPESKLRQVINSREERWWKFLSSSDQFNPERVDFDRELVRRFYLERGYADVSVTGSVAELTPDRRAFFLTFSIEEGPRYRLGQVQLVSKMPKVDAHAFQPLISIQGGAWFNGRSMDHDATVIETAIHQAGFPFAKVAPLIRRNPAAKTVDVTFEVTEGPRVYIERIDIYGNSVTKDKVIRRQFQFAEGDPYNTEASKLTKQRLTDLGYFTDVKLTTQPGATADRVVVNTEITEKATGELSLGGGYSSYSGVLAQAGLKQVNLIGTGIDAGISGSIAQRQSQVDVSATDPYFLDRNLVAGADLYTITNNNLQISAYSETRIGTTLRIGYAYNDHLSQAWNYTVADRDTSNIQSYASIYVTDEAGWSLLSQIGQTLALDYRDSRSAPHSGFILRFATDFAGLGGDENYIRAKLDGTYFQPLDFITGNSDWGLALSAGAGKLQTLSGRQRIIDRFFLGGDNLRGFADSGAGPHAVAYTTVDPIYGLLYHGRDALGGTLLYTASAELRVPLPVSPDFGLSGRVFADAGGLSGLSVPSNANSYCLGFLPHNASGQHLDFFNHVVSSCEYNDSAPRASVGLGVSWKSPFGLINIDIADPILKKPYDQTQVFKFGFGTRFQ